MITTTRMTAINETTILTFPTGTDRRKRSTLTFTCRTSDEAFAYIKKFAPIGYWAQIICVSDGLIELHLRPLEEKDD